jgi:hypothetical protein
MCVCMRVCVCVWKSADVEETPVDRVKGRTVNKKTGFVRKRKDEIEGCDTITHFHRG